MKTDFVSYSARLNYLLELIEKKQISTPSQICEKFSCCNKTARNMTNKLREMGYNIEYCRLSKKYFIKNL